MDAQQVTQGTLRTRDGHALPLERTEVSASITGAIADVSVKQVFHNTRAVAIEAVYSFPLPHEASVYRMRFVIEDRVVQGVVKEKAEARAVYEKARAEGRAATLLEEDAPAVFTLSVANVAPGATIVVELGYQEVLPYDDGRWCFVFPMVAPERFADAGAQGLGALRVPSGTRAPDVTIEVMVRGDGEVESLRCPTHKIQTRNTDDGVPIVTLAAEGDVPNKDFVLTWRAGDTGVRPWLRFERTEGDVGTFLLMLTPSVPRENTEAVGGRGDLKAVRCGNCGGVIQDLSSIKEIPGLGPVVPCAYCGALLAPGTEVITRASRPRDVLVLVDRSASMRGALPTMQRAVRTLLDTLGPGDGAQIMAFDHDRTAFDGDGSRFAVISPELITMAERFLASLTPRGGTELEEALERAAKLPAREGRTRVVVLITDAAVGNEGRLLRRLPSLLGASTRLFVLGLGRAVDRRLIEKLARVGGGASDIALGGDSEAETLARFARRVREGGAVLTNLTLYWENAEMVDVYPKALPDLYGGQPLRVLGRFTHVGMTKLVITGATAEGKPFRQELSIGLPARTERSPGITRLWARRRVEELAEHAAGRGLDAAACRTEGTALSLAQSIVGPFTSLVAEDLKVTVAKGGGGLRLRVTHGPDAGKTLRIERAKVTIGRSDDCAFVLSDALVSRHHVELEFNGDTWTLRDQQSTGGTKVDSVATREGVVRVGSTLSIGFTTIVLESDGNEAGSLPMPRIHAPGGMAPPPVMTQTGGVSSFDLIEDEEIGSLFEDDLALPPVNFAPPPALLDLDMSFAGPPPRASAPMAPAAISPAPMRPPTGMSPAPFAPGAAPIAAPMTAPPAAAPPFMGAPPPSSPGYAPPAFGPPHGYSPPPGFMPPPTASAGATPPRQQGLFGRIFNALTGRSGHPPPEGPTPLPVSPPPVFPPVAPPPVTPPVAHATKRPTSSEPFVTCARCNHENPKTHRFCLLCGGDMHTRVATVPYSAPGAVFAPIPQAPAPPMLVSEPYTDEELAWFRTRHRGELDLVFLVDETQSMARYITQVREQLLALVRELTASPLCRQLRLGIVTYRDHPPQDPTYASRVVPLTEDIAAIRAEVEKLHASGGGDGPESVTDGLYDLVRLDWRPSASRAVVWFGDAPPHGVEPDGDDFPQGCPCGHHWFTQAESCREMGVTVYAIGCLPTIRSYKGAEAVFRQVADTTHGVYLPLREASLLVPLIVGAASAELDRQRLDEHVAEIVPEGGDGFARTTEAERVRWLAQTLSARNVRVRAMDFDPNATTPAPMRFRPVTERDLEGSLDRLRAQGRLSA